jgi:hypothetical protein
VPRGRRAFRATDLVVPALAALTLSAIAALAQTPALDSGTDLLTPVPEGTPNSLQRNRGANGNASSQNQAPPTGVFTPSRIGVTPVYGTQPGFGAGDTGFDSSNTGRGKRPAKKAAPTTAPTVAGQAPPDLTFTPVPTFSPALPAPPAPPPPPPPAASGVQPLKAGMRPGAVLPPVPDTVPVSNPPASVYPRPAAERPGAVLPIPSPLDFQPSASTPPPGTPPLNTLPLGTPPLRPLPIAAGDPYAPLGLRAGSFLLYPSVDLSAGYNSDPENVPHGPSSSLFVVAPELQVQSDWSRHSLTADIKGTYDLYGADLVPSLNLPYFSSVIDGRIDVLRDTQILLENRFLLSTNNPGSPNNQADLARLPIYTDVGGTLGLAQTFNRLQVTAKATFDSVSYQDSVLTNGEVVSNADEDYNQYGGTLRVGYELGPGLKPFVEVGADERIYDQQIDAAGLQRDSTGSSVKVGGDVNLFGSLTGEIAAGYLQRVYQDPTLPDISGPTLDGALIWQATALTTAKFTAATTVTESVLPGTSGELSRAFNLQVDHAFLLRLIGTGQVGYEHDDYVGLGRLDNRYFTSVGLIYKLSREIQLKGTVREDWLTSNFAGVAYEATSFLVGVRLQR